MIVMSNDEEEVEALPSSGGSYRAPPLAECIGPVVTVNELLARPPDTERPGSRGGRRS